MKDEELDELLRELLKNGINHPQPLIEVINQSPILKNISEINVRGMARFLWEEKKFLQPGPGYSYAITASGKYFLSNGGFTKQSEIEKEILNAAKGAFIYARKSYLAVIWIGLLTIVITLIGILLPIYLAKK